jgi:flavin reductase (DIM6/NTAB) family NADH-FMN oxidoreductase RutF
MENANMDLQTYFLLSYGVYLISSHTKDKINGMIATAVCQVTAETVIITVAINKQNLTHEMIESSRSLGISILKKETSFEFIGSFGFKSGRTADKLIGIGYKTGITGVPIVLDNTVGYVETEVINSIDVGTHTIFITKAVDAQILSQDEPLTYAYYHIIKGGRSPKAAPTSVINKK